MNDSGFTCEAIDCPPLPANCPSFSVPSGECCPVCKTEQCTTGIAITNCPSDTVHIYLTDDQSNIVYQFQPSVRDCLQLSRDVTYIKTPVGDIYEWQVTPYDISITASVVQQDGYHKDSDTCRFSLKVVDVTPPTLICPENVKKYTTSDTAVVQWTAPTVSDNVEVLSVKSTPAWGSSFPVGVTQVTYTATDKAGLTSTCRFLVNVTKIGSRMCHIPNLQHGQFECTERSLRFNCSVRCHPGYIYQNTITGNSITCTGGKWDKTIPENFELYSCLKKVAGTLQGAIRVTAPGACGHGDLDLTYTKKAFENVIHSQYLILSIYPLKVSVEVDGCEDPDISVTVTVSGHYINAADEIALQENIDFVLEQIQQGLTKGFLGVPVSDGSSISVAVIIDNPIKVNITSACLPGTYQADDVGCIVCPSGTYQLHSECVPCINGTYNDKDEQTSCVPCPMGATSPAGAYIVDQCTVETDLVLILSIAAGVVGAIVLIIIITVAVYLCKKQKLKNKKVPAVRVLSMMHDNKLYDMHHQEVYDEIGDNVQGQSDYLQPISSVYLASAQPNDYEHVPKAANVNREALNAPYDKLGDSAVTASN
jgi:hypothetical protein